MFMNSILREAGEHFGGKIIPLVLFFPYRCSQTLYRHSHSGAQYTDGKELAMIRNSGAKEIFIHFSKI
jgi:hypothetical protein